VRKVLYIVSNGSALSSDLLPRDRSPEHDISVLLIEDGVGLKDVPGSRVFALSEDAVSRNVTPAFPTVSYRDMLQMILDADTVVAL
jgi:sulfur transfer complex TusBCD TusB component (DsrH family)